MKKIILPVITILIIGGLGFFGGTLYAKASSGKNLQSNGFGNFQPGTSPLGDRTGSFQKGTNKGTGMTSGEILSIDEKSLTLKLPDNGSKLILLSDTTEISKFATATKDELKIGTQLMINGTTNTEGSITAKSIQIRPEISISDNTKPQEI